MELKFPRSNQNSIPNNELVFGKPAVVHKNNEPLQFCIGGQNNRAMHINTYPFQIKIGKTLETTVVVTPTTVLNLVELLTNADITAENQINLQYFSTKFLINETVGGIIFPPLKYYAQYNIRVNYFGNFSGNTNLDNQFLTELRRGQDDSFIASANYIKVGGKDLGTFGATHLFSTFTQDLQDPYIVLNGGLKIILSNLLRDTINLTRFEILIQGQATNYEQI